MGEREILAALKDIGVELHKTDRALARLERRIGRPAGTEEKTDD